MKKIVSLIGMLLLSLVLMVNTYMTESKNEWKISHTFEKDGAMIRGWEERIGFEDAPLVAGKEHRLTWYLWDEETLEEEESEVKVVAVNKSTGRVLTLLENHTVKVDEDDLSATFPADFSFPDAGKWRLDVYLNDRHCGKVVVEVRHDETNT